MSHDGERDTGPHAHDGAGPPPPLGEGIEEIGQAGRATFAASADALRALRALVSADLAMARSALGRGLAWAGVAVVFGASGWLLATAAAVALMQWIGLSWLASLSIAATANLAVTALAVWRTSRFFEYMGMHATRRQLTRMGMFDEDDGDPAQAGAPGADADPPAATGMPAPPTGGLPR